MSLIFGRIGDIYGRHTLFGLGLIVSSLGALACGLSQNVTQLILFRIFQGVGASMTQSQGRALAIEAMPKESSGKAQGFMTTAFHSGVLIGPSIGGLIIDYIHWRATFFFLIPIAMCAIALTLVNRARGNVPRPVPVAGNVQCRCSDRRCLGGNTSPPNVTSLRLDASEASSSPNCTIIISADGVELQTVKR